MIPTLMAVGLALAFLPRSDARPKVWLAMVALTSVGWGLLVGGAFGSLLALANLCVGLAIGLATAGVGRMVTRSLA